MTANQNTAIFNLGHAIEILEATPSVLRNLLSELSDEWILEKDKPDSWSPYDIVGHLIHGEKTDWIQRASIILELGEFRPFDPFDRFAQFKESAGKSVGDLLAEFAALRQRNVTVLKKLSLTEEDLEKRGTHPAFGQVSLKQLLATWVVHDLGHIRQIARVMAKRYQHEVGPWQAYLPVLHE